VVRIPPSKAFSNLSHADELKKIIKAAKNDIANNIGNKEELLVLISENEKELNKIEHTLVSKMNNVSETIIDNNLKETLIHTSIEIKTTEIINISNSPSKVEDKYRKEPVPKSSSSWKKIDFSGRTTYKPPDSEVSKVKKTLVEILVI
jgi:hypothetical protein